MIVTKKDMKKNEFIAECAQKSGLTKKDTREVLDIFFSVIVDHMKDEDGISPYTGIKFHANYKEAYEGHMPGSGEKIMVLDDSVTYGGIHGDREYCKVMHPMHGMGYMLKEGLKFD